MNKLIFLWIVGVGLLLILGGVRELINIEENNTKKDFDSSIILKDTTYIPIPVITDSIPPMNIDSLLAKYKTITLSEIELKQELWEFTTHIYAFIAGRSVLGDSSDNIVEATEAIINETIEKIKGGKENE